MQYVPQEQFTAAVLAEKDAVGICYAPVGVVESSFLNRTKGISAALVHNKYLAQMCRRVHAILLSTTIAMLLYLESTVWAFNSLLVWLTTIYRTLLTRKSRTSYGLAKSKIWNVPKTMLNDSSRDYLYPSKVHVYHYYETLH